jgi:hypothetical protein
MKTIIWHVITTVGGELTVKPFSGDTAKADATDHAWSLILDRFNAKSAATTVESLVALYEGNFTAAWADVAAADTLHVQRIEVELAVPVSNRRVWCIAKDDDEGTTSELYGTEAEMQAALWDWFSEMDDDGRTPDELREEFDNDEGEAFDALRAHLTTATWGPEDVDMPDLYPAMTAALRKAREFFATGDDDDSRAMVATIDNALSGVPYRKPPVHIGVTLEGGMVQDVFSNDPDHCPLVTVIDYDTEGADEADVSPVPQLNSAGEIEGEADAIVHVYDTLGKWGSQEWFEAVRNPARAESDDETEG